MKKTLIEEQKDTLLETLKTRFEKNMERHEGLEWAAIQERLEAEPSKLWTLNEMEATEGEPDVVKYDAEKDVYVFYDCSKESPKGRRSLCYDREALEGRKKHPPRSSAMDVAQEMGVNMLTEEQYRELQQLGNFDLKTSTWIETPEKIRKLGGAIFCDYRFDHLFVYHNGADSYYGSRGFRGSLEV
ncbi:hypothetical protein KZO01_19160 [Kurthia zopfii]|uniref:Uncharacterized protein DUF4256 n=2 Tax=Kurthia zopfii TaxID=1650 RepID=A0A8B4QEA6_9BACL|nr:uncharacterized protein DUF4256 [Kurthia zopfii]GEK31607.1 hypothetical protein KZO01_19160 [Kurthia zopfii]STX11037.1 Uncharacterised protein [Kurthia zopfii]VEI05594.1 Uncharacterised protein [Kurthia zopfii]